MYDVARLFGDFGIELERLAWKPDDLFGMPRGFVWFIKGNYPVAIGSTTVQLGNSRIWLRGRDDEPASWDRSRHAVIDKSRRGGYRLNSSEIALSEHIVKTGWVIADGTCGPVFPLDRGAD